MKVDKIFTLPQKILNADLLFVRECGDIGCVVFSEVRYAISQN